MKHVFLISLFSVALGVGSGGGFVVAQDEPIVIDPSYNECFQMAQDAVKAEQIGIEMEADVLQGADPMEVPAETPETQKRKQVADAFYPGLQGEQDFEKALLESGAEIIIDPENPGAAPKVELSGVRPPEPKAPSPNHKEVVEQNSQDAPSAADIFQQKKDVCRIKYGISF